MIILYRFLFGITCYASILHATDLYDQDRDPDSDDIVSDSNGEDSKSAIDTEPADDLTENTADTPDANELNDSSDTDLGSLAKSAEDLLKGSNDDDDSDDSESSVSSTKKEVSALAEEEVSEMQDKLPDLAKMFG